MERAGVLDFLSHADSTAELPRLGGMHHKYAHYTHIRRIMKPGRYRLWCSLADHRALGMQTVLRVRRR